jgi:sigma-E factor negative regulatory protein RseB
MSRLARAWLPALVASHLCAGIALADEVDPGEALRWLEKIAQAARELNYRGTFVYQHGDQAKTSRITHLADRSGDFEKLEMLDGPPTVIIRNSNEIITYDAEKGLVKRERRTARKQFPALLPDRFATLTEYYRLRKGGQARIAGYDAQALILEPRDEFRYGHKLWAEASTGLLLKARMINERNQALEQFHFTEVAINVAISPEAVRPSFPLPPDTLPVTPGGPTDTGWTVRNQPAGFKKIMEMKRAKRSGGGSVAHLVFSDGLAAVSVFIEPLAPSAKVFEGLSHQGAVNIYTRSVSDQLVTVLGETPPVTVMQIANSVSPKPR